MSDNDDDRKPRFEGNFVPTNISLMDDDEDYGEETTRRVAFEPVMAMNPTTTMQEPSMISLNRNKVHPGSVAHPTQATGRDSWELRVVPTLPEYHPLERTSVFVPNAVPSEVSARISRVLRDRSIEAFYEDEKAKVKCVTADGVDFRVRLYRGRGSFAHGIIVEVQRRFGSSMNFHNDTMAILDAAEGKTPSTPPPSFGSSSSSLPMVSDSEEDYQANGASSLEMVAKMFAHSGYDSHYLAYQTLIPLTDSAKMGRGTARSVSMELLKPGNVVGSKVLSLVTAKDDEEDMFKLRTMAMTVLANAIQALKGQIDMGLREEIRPQLIQKLYEADKNPRSAQMAAVCVEHLIQDDHFAAEFHDALEKAYETGTARHAGLERQAKKCLEKLQGTAR
jgi:hypothetical protein